MMMKPTATLFQCSVLTAAVLLAWTSQSLADDGTPAPTNLKNAEAVKEVLSGERTEANAAWWGFNNQDTTATIQAALDSGAKKVTIPYMGSPWIVRPLQLRGHQEVYLEPGVVILAKRGEFRGRGDSLMTAGGVENVVLRGHGATLKMHKTDYMAPPYDKAEWRMGLSLRGCRNVLVEGLRIESSGGDGIYIDGGSGQRFCKDVTIRNVTCFDNHRQGMSVISVDGLLVEHCTFANTWGTAPAAGIDLEPDGDDQSLVNIVIRDCTMENNEGHEILVYPKNLREHAPDISIRFENCYIRKTLTNGRPDGVAQGIGRNDQHHGWSGISVAGVCDNGPGGLIEFVHCVVENTGKESVRIYDKSPDKAALRFVHCQFRNSWMIDHPDHWLHRVPIHLQIRRPKLATDLGGVEFADCYVFDSVARPVLSFEGGSPDHRLRGIAGDITVDSPGEPRMEPAGAIGEIDLELIDTPVSEPEPPRQPDADAE